MKNTISICMQILIGFCFVVESSTAADFTFNVPVNLYAQPSNFNEGLVICAIGNSNQELNLDPENPSGSGILGFVEQPFSLDSQGNFQETLTLLIDAESIEAAIAAKQWRCSLYVKDDNNGHLTHPQNSNGIEGQSSPVNVSGSIGM